jgi:glycosyltransferase involved in cell wall biosynthesis
MNILRIVYDWPDENVITEGLAPAPFELSKAQTKLGHFVFVLCGNLNGKNLIARRFRIFLPEFFIEVFNLPRAIAGIGPFFTTSIFIVPSYFYLKVKNKIDIVHNHGHLGVWFLLYKYLFGWLDKTPVVGHFHNTAKGRERAIKKQGGRIPFLAKYIEYPIHKFSDRLMLKVCNEVIVVGETLADELVEFYNIEKRHIHLVESGVDSDRFDKTGERIDFGFDPNSIIVLNIGRLSKRKNIDVLVEAMARLPNEYKLVLCGEWDPGFRKKVEEIITASKLKDRIKYIGKVSYFDIDKYFRSAQIFVLPSSYEGLPKVVLEALSSGCKVIASGFKIDRQIPDLKFIPEITSDVIAEEIVESHERLSDPEETKKIINDSYSWDTKANQIEDVYKLLLKRKNA